MYDSIQHVVNEQVMGWVRWVIMKVASLWVFVLCVRYNCALVCPCGSNEGILLVGVQIISGMIGGEHCSEGFT